MRGSKAATLVVGLSLVLATPAMGADDGATLDAKCLAFAGILVTQKDPTMKEVGEALHLFYMGRISARNLSVDLSKAIVDLRPELAGGIGPTRDKCAAPFGAAGNLVKVDEPPKTPR